MRCSSAAEKESKFFCFYILAHNLPPVVSVLKLIGLLLRVNIYVSFGQWVGQPHPFQLGGVALSSSTILQKTLGIGTAVKFLNPA